MVIRKEQSILTSSVSDEEANVRMQYNKRNCKALKFFMLPF